MKALTLDDTEVGRDVKDPPVRRLANMERLPLLQNRPSTGSDVRKGWADWAHLDEQLHVAGLAGVLD